MDLVPPGGDFGARDDLQDRPASQLPDVLMDLLGRDFQGAVIGCELFLGVPEIHAGMRRHVVQFCMAVSI